MESFETAANMGLSTNFSQVVFQEIPNSYVSNVALTCCYTLTAAIQPNPRDWVGIFKVGWSTTKDYHTFVWVEPSLDLIGLEPVRKQVLFTAYYLPKDDAAFYQFCYIDSNDQVRGASTPFCFKTPGEQSTDCSLENDLLVIITQEKVEQREREKEELVMELGQLKEQNETLRSALKEQQQEIDHLKMSNEELYQADGNTENKRENARKHEELTQNTKLMDDSHRGQETLTTICEKYEQALIKIKQLKKEREELKGKVEVQSVEIAQLSPRLKESEQESHKLKDHIQLLQVDLQSSEKEKEKLQDLKTENKALRRSLSEQEQQPLQMVDIDWKEQYQALLGQLEEAQTQLHKELQASNNTRKRAEQAERELEELKECMESTAMTSDQTKQKSSKLEMQLSELNEIIEEKENMAEIAKVEKEELSRENQDLKRDIERLRKEFDDVQAAAVPMQHPNPYGSSTDPTANKEQQQQEALADSLHFGNPYETPGTATNLEEELSLECRHCHESFPGITQDELELHEHSHRACPFCTLICDGMEQALYEDHVYSHEV
ncbi:calcium-binding and coiled-coil domain-containing protein 2 [Salmo salar]|nr:calcium-binding and coiled-coil domain-containing protein 2 [Salmo salar]ACH70816.1 calcium binding and coiled-coil domain 2-like [Salmo salar]ACI33203.1 Calcium-binding and coiled-coil domain-containing protein 2 [Salmo salar]|eukprot:NP_001135383.1 Calcium-binding and coiled-coil domain-containing protein 2 [Salmo salar]